MSAVDAAPQQRVRLDSIDGYYSTIDQLMGSPDDEINKYLTKTKKDSIICLFKELLSQHRQTLSRFDETTSLKTDLKELKESLTNNSARQPELDSSGQSSSNPQAKSYSDVLLNKNGVEHAKKLRFSGIPEFISASDNKAQRSDIFEHEVTNVTGVLTHLGIDTNEPVASIKRLGPFKPESTRPRTIIVKFKNELISERLSSRATHLKDYSNTYNQKVYKVYLSKSLKPDEIKILKKLLERRRQRKC